MKEMVLELGLEKKNINLGLVLKYSQLYINLQSSFIWRNYSQEITVCTLYSTLRPKNARSRTSFCIRRLATTSAYNKTGTGLD